MVSGVCRLSVYLWLNLPSVVLQELTSLFWTVECVATISCAIPLSCSRLLGLSWTLLHPRGGWFVALVVVGRHLRTFLLWKTDLGSCFPLLFPVFGEFLSSCCFRATWFVVSPLRWGLSLWTLGLLMWPCFPLNTGEPQPPVSVFDCTRGWVPWNPNFYFPFAHRWLRYTVWRCS